MVRTHKNSRFVLYALADIRDSKDMDGLMQTI